MKKNITPRFKKSSTEKNEMVVVPSVETLDFIKGFARSYCVNENLPPSLNSVFVN